jgi:glycosyltransferase involved in cell wall biosynthesis
MAAIPVLLLVRELGIGGCERDLARAATHFDPARIRAHVACFHPDGIRTEDIRSRNIPILALPLTSFANRSFPLALQQLHSYVRQHNIALIHSFDTPSACLLAAYGLMPGHVPIIASHLCHRDLIDNRGQQLLLRLGDRTANSFVSNSRAVGEELSSRFGIDSQYIDIVYNGVDTNSFHPGLPQALAPEPDTLTIGTVCALRPEKRIDLLIQAVARLQSQGNKLRLLIIGAGPEEERLRDSTRQLGIAHHCHFAGLQRNIPPWLASMDIFVLPSSSESFPNSLLEAMACGVAVIGSCTGGIPEMIETQKTGLLFEPNQVDSLVAAIQELLNGPDLRTTLARNAAEVAASRYSSASYASHLEAVYRKRIGY